MRASMIASALAALVLVGASTTAASAPSGQWAKLRRPLHIPHIGAGARCPVAVVTRPSKSYEKALGRGPAYPLFPGAPTFGFFYPVPPSQNWYPSDWGGDKTLWIVAPRYSGPLLIRGRQLDGPNPVRFDDGSLPPSEFRMAAGGAVSTGGFRSVPLYTRLRAPGCYAWQVDGTSFGRVIVFRAVVE